MLPSMLIRVAGMLTTSQSMLSSAPMARVNMLIVVVWLPTVTVSVIIVVKCILTSMPGLIVKVGLLLRVVQSVMSSPPLPRVSMLIHVHCMLIIVDCMLTLVHCMPFIVDCMLIIGGMLDPLPLPRVSHRSLCRHPCTSFQLKKKRYELLRQLAEIEKLVFDDDKLSGIPYQENVYIGPLAIVLNFFPIKV